MSGEQVTDGPVGEERAISGISCIGWRECLLQSRSKEGEWVHIHDKRRGGPGEHPTAPLGAIAVGFSGGMESLNDRKVTARGVVFILRIAGMVVSALEYVK